MHKVLALAATLVLAGCFQSEAPLYPDSAGACPFTSATSFGIPQVDAGERTARVEAFSIVPDGRHCIRTSAMAADAEPERALFVPLGGGWYVVQGGEEGGYLYQLSRIEGDRIELYLPACGDFTSAALSELGIEVTQVTSPQTVPEEPAALEAPSSRRKSDGPKQANSVPGVNQPTLLCNPTTSAQLEAAFRAWIALGRPPGEYGERMR